MRYLIGALLLLAVIGTASAQTYTRQQANATITNATLFISEVNESAYLIFYPNMGKADMYLAYANNALNTSPDQAVMYASEAESAATVQYYAISAYRKASLVAMAVFSIVMAALLYTLMQNRRGKV